MISKRKYHVYRNLNGGYWSILDPKTGLVVAHSKIVEMFDVDFVIQPGGQKRAREEGSRNVHAYARGHLLATIQDALIPFRDREIEWLSPFGVEDPKTASEFSNVISTFNYKSSDTGTWLKTTYNPFQHDTFVDHNRKPVYHADYVEFKLDKLGHAEVNSFICNNDKETPHGSDSFS